MKWTLQELRKFQGETIPIHETLMLKEKLTERETQLIDVEPVEVTGTLSVEKEDVIAHVDVKTGLRLPSTRSLKETHHAIDLSFDEVFMTPEQLAEHADIDPKDVTIVENQTIDLESAVIDYILLNIPTQVFTPEELAGEEMPAGTDWEVITEEEYNERQAAEKEQKVDPRLAKLSEFLKKDDDQ